MDQELLDALERLRQQLHEDIHASAAETRRYVDGVVAASAAETRGYAETIVVAAAEGNRRHAENLAQETRRHFHVVAEHLNSKIRLMAEGIVALDEKVERFRGEVHDGFHKIDGRLLRLEARVSALERQ